MKKLITTIVMSLMFSGAALSVELLKADFSGAPGSGGVNNLTIPAGNITVHPNVLNGTFNVLGGTADSTQWVYSEGGDALLNTDLFTSSNWGGPTRMDLGLELATTGKEYSISDIQVVLSETNANNISCRLWHATDEAAQVRYTSTIMIIPAGSTGTYTLAVANLGLKANDTTANWNQAGNGDLRLEFYEPTSGTNVDNLVIDSIRINGTVVDYVPPVIETVSDWEFNTLGDTEGWKQGSTSNIVGLTVAAAVSGPETVLTSQGISGSDPWLVREGLFSPETNYWAKAVIRARQIDSEGTPLPWDSAGCAVVIDSTIVSQAIGGSGWRVKAEADEWIVASIDISQFETNVISGARFDPVGSPAATNKNFEVDYIQLTTSPTAPPQSVKTLMHSWEFNTPGDTEGLAGSAHIVGLTATNTISGSESVLTSADIIGNDPMVNFPSGTPISAEGGTWTTLEFRARQLTGNPGEAGVVPQTWAVGGTIVLVNGNNRGGIPSANVTVSNEVDGWVTATCDISVLTGSNINNFRIDPIGQAVGATKNFEIDYIRAYAMQPAGGFDSWAYDYALYGADADSGADPDNDLFSNFYEFSFGGDPTDKSVSGIMPVSKLIESGESDVIEYVYFRRSDPDSGVVYSLESNTDLVFGSWADYVDYTEVGVGPFNFEMDAVTNHIPVDVDVQFIQTKVTGE